MRIVTLGAVCLTASLGLLLAPAARATTMVPMSLAELIAESDIVAHVRVGDAQAVVRDGVPYSVADLLVLESFKGTRSGAHHQLWQRGGGRYRAVGDPVLSRGQEGLAFLRVVEGRVYLTALAQSFWWIEDRGADRWARRDLSGVTLFPGHGRSIQPPDLVLWPRLRVLLRDGLTGGRP